MINSLQDIIFNNKKIIITNYENKYPLYDIYIDIKTTLKQKFFFLEKISKENNQFVNIIFHCKDNYLIKDFQIFLKKNINYLIKISFYFKNVDKINSTIIKQNIEKKKFKEVNGFLTPSLFFILDKCHDLKISNLIFCNLNKNIIQTYLDKFGLKFYQYFLWNFHKSQLELYNSYENFFKELESEDYGKYIDYIFPNLDYLNILDKQGYLYYSGGWSMTRPRQVLNLLKCLNLNKKFFAGKTVLELGPGLCDFLKVAKFCGSTRQTVIDKNPVFLMLSKQIGVNEVIQFDFQKDNLESLFVPKTDILFIKGFLNVYYYEMDLIEEILQKFTQSINEKGSGFWFTYNTYFDQISKKDYEMRLNYLTKLFKNYGWEKINFNEEQLRLSGLAYSENTNVLPFKIEKNLM